MVTQIVKNLLIPGSIPVFVLGLLASLILLHLSGTCRRWGKRFLLVLTGLYLLLSTPYAADILAKGLYYEYSPITDANQVHGSTAVVVLSGGSETYIARGYEFDSPSRPSMFRVMEAAYIYNLLDEPLMILSGGIGDPRYQLNPESNAMAKVIVEMGIKNDRIRLESRSQNTHDQGVNVAKLLKKHNIDKFVLVTSPTHMRRAQSVFAAQGFDSIAAIAPGGSDKIKSSHLPFLPTVAGLFASQSAMREYLATTYYWAHGWLR